jgi:hypothetical protein
VNAWAALDPGRVLAQAAAVEDADADAGGTSSGVMKASTMRVITDSGRTSTNSTACAGARHVCIHAGCKLAVCMFLRKCLSRILLVV